MQSPESQKVTASKNMAKEQVVRSIRDIADDKGLTREACVQTIKKGLDADSPKAYLKAAEMGLKLHGELRDDKTILPIPVTKEQYQSLCLEFWNARPK